jgi:hypothetical protein
VHLLVINNQLMTQNARFNHKDNEYCIEWEKDGNSRGLIIPVSRNIHEESEEIFETPSVSQCSDRNSIQFPPDYKVRDL